MVSNEDDARISRRSVLRATATTLGVGTGLAETGAASPERASVQDDPYEGFVCGAALSDGETFTVEPRCDGGCEAIRATGLAPECSGGNEDIYVNLHGTDGSVWVTPTDRRVGSPVRTGSSVSTGAAGTHPSATARPCIACVSGRATTANET